MSEASPGSGGGTIRLALMILRRFLPGQHLLVILGILLLLAGSALAVLQPWPLKLILDSVVGSQPPPAILSSIASSLPGHLDPRVSMLILLCAAVLLVELIAGILNVLSTSVLVAVGLRMVFQLRCALFDHVQRLSLRFHDRSTVGDSLYRITWDTYSVQAIFNSGLLPAVSAAATLIGITAVMLQLDKPLTLTALGVIVPLVLLVRRVDRPMTEHSMRVHERESEVSTRVEETLSGIRAVQAFGRESIESERFRARAGESLRANLRLTILQAASGAAASILLAAGTALVIGIAAWRVMQHRLTAGDVVLLSAYVAMLYKPLETLAYTAANVQSAVAGAQRVLSILDSHPDITDAPDALELPARVWGRIGYEGVSFAYEPGKTALQSIDLAVEPGQTLALVGTSGSGKTTLVSLLLRFYDPDKGRITLDGHDLRTLRLSSLRKNIAIVLQEPVLFGASIRENIAYGRPGASLKDVETAAKAAGAHDFIMAFPEGYETRIGERGVSLSGGQRQRISIARAFLKDAPILILDEPTSALDADSEEALLHSLDRLRQGRTTLIIAHRLSTVRSADAIVVLKDGRVVESGTHAQLLSRHGDYARLHEKQFGPEPALAGGQHA